MRSEEKIKKMGEANALLRFPDGFKEGAQYDSNEALKSVYMEGYVQANADNLAKENVNRKLMDYCVFRMYSIFMDSDIKSIMLRWKSFEEIYKQIKQESQQQENNTSPNTNKEK